MRSAAVEQTRASFDYQWSNLRPNEWSLANPEFRDTVPEFICRLTELDREWFAGKDVLDAGCGAGRFAFGLCRLGARVTAIDRSMAALRHTRIGCADFPHFRGAVAADLLQQLPFDGAFDLVWSYGVLHSTGDTRGAFRRVAGHVKPGGYLFVMLYGEPRHGCFDDHRALAALEAWRRRCAKMSFAEKAAVIGDVTSEDHLIEYFDMISPWINERHTEDELRGWFAEERFADVARRLDHMDHYLIARRLA